MKDTDFVRGRVPMTKMEIRAVIASYLELESARRLLDIGAGTGSVTVEACTRHPHIEAVAIERNEAGCALIRANAAQHGAHCSVICGEAPLDAASQALGQKRFDRVYIGGTGGRLPEIMEWLEAEVLEAGAIVVFSTITLESMAAVLAYVNGDARYAEVECSQIQANRLEALGRYHYFKPMNPCTVIKAVYGSRRLPTEAAGRLYGIGVGPGDPELLTVKAVRVLGTLDVLMVPSGDRRGGSVAHACVARYIPQRTPVEPVHFPMTRDAEVLEAAHAEIARRIEDHVRSGARVGFVTLGDPMLYSTLVYVLKRLTGRIPIEMIPGISSFGAIASATGRVLAEGNMPLTIYPCAEGLEGLEALLNAEAAVVLMKVYRQFAEVKALLERMNLLDCAVLASNYGMEDARIVEDLRTCTPEDVGYFSTILINQRLRREMR